MSKHHLSTKVLVSIHYRDSRDVISYELVLCTVACIIMFSLDWQWLLCNSKTICLFSLACLDDVKIENLFITWQDKEGLDKKEGNICEITQRIVYFVIKIKRSVQNIKKLHKFPLCWNKGNLYQLFAKFNSKLSKKTTSKVKWILLWGFESRGHFYTVLVSLRREFYLKI